MALTAHLQWSCRCRPDPGVVVIGPYPERRTRLDLSDHADLPPARDLVYERLLFPQERQFIHEVENGDMAASVVRRTTHFAGVVRVRNDRALR
jgi:hypothetical protein